MVAHALVAAGGLGHIGHSALDIMRLAIACLAVLLVGTNIAFVLHAPRIFPPKVLNFWRLFFFGKSFITLSLGLIFFLRAYNGRPFSVISVFALIGVVLSNYSLFQLWNRESDTVFIELDGDGKSGETVSHG